MAIKIKIPSVGESVTEALLAEWFKADGDSVQKDEPLFVIETDKVTLEVVAEQAGRLSIQVEAGTTVAVRAVVGTIDTEAAVAEEKPKPAAPEQPEKAPAPEAAPTEEKAAPKPEAPAPSPSTEPAAGDLSPAVRRLVKETGVDPSSVAGTGPGGRITKGDVILYLEQGGETSAPARPSASLPSDEAEAAPTIQRVAMTPIRQRIASRLLEARQNTAMLTTFNEIDMSRAMAIRARYKDAFAKRHGVGLGFMSFFIKACVSALAEVPEINAFVDGTDIIYNRHQHIGVAVGSEKGLVVPVIRNAETLGFAELEQAIVDYVAKIKNNRLALADLEGGTFTISNGGVYGSLLSTPILNTPQSGILGMHKIEKRPVVVDDEVVVRPMMYVALSYDHRIVDGKGAVTFLKRVKEFIEDPERIMMEI